MSTLRFSVITPSFNQGRFIERTIQSVLKQGLPATDYEYMVCDGGSSDDTVEILKRYEGQLRWVSEPDRGQADAVNKGIQMTSGDIIAWINSDDVYYPGAFAAVRAVFESDLNVQAVYGDADYINEHDRVLYPHQAHPWDYGWLPNTCYLCQPAVFFRRRLVEELGALDPSLHYCLDYELWFRYGQRYPFYYLRQKLAGSRMYPTNKSLGQAVAARSETSAMLLQKLGYIPEIWVWRLVHSIMQEEFRGKPEGRRQNIRFATRLVFTSFKVFRERATRLSISHRVALLSWWGRTCLSRQPLKRVLKSYRKIFIDALEWHHS
jgi:glycosyltransferase involved in cell wall biosynthesis